MARPINPKAGPGRKTKDIEHATAMQILEGSTIAAANVVSELIRGTRKRISQQRWSAVVFDLEQCLGKARQKIEHSGGIMTYGDLAKSAEALDKKPRPILAEVEELANKHAVAEGATPTPEDVT